MLSSEQDVRIYHYRHVLYICVAAMAVCWGTTLLWQADVIQAQCDGFLWLVYVPAGFLVEIVSVKAYRLSTFLNRNQSRRAKTFPHSRVMRLTWAMVGVTVLFVLIAAVADPPTRHHVMTDPYRAKLDHYYCRTLGATDALMYVLVVGHVLLSAYCVASVRNGLDAFRDGTIMKEAFVLLYAFVLIALVSQHFGLSPANAYMARSVLVNIGVTIFVLRLLINRCIRHWVPEIMLIAMAQVQQKSVKQLSGIFSSAAAPLSGITRVKSLTGIDRADAVQPRRIVIQSLGSVNLGNGDEIDNGDEDVGPLYRIAVPQESNLDEMIATIADPVRGEMFRNFARLNLVEENYDFLSEVLSFQKTAENELIIKSSEANGRIREVAEVLYHRFIRQGADDEVNVPSKIRLQIETALDNSNWIISRKDNIGSSKAGRNDGKDAEEDAPFIARELARDVLKDDPRKRGMLFEPAFKEILTLLYQNIWSKFLAH